MENLRLGVSAVRHDMKREETVEEAEKNTELGRHTPKPGVAGSNPVWRAKISAIRPFFQLIADIFCLLQIIAPLPRIY